MLRANLTNHTVKLFFLLLFMCGTADAQVDTWLQAEPSRVVPEQVAVFVCDGAAQANLRWIFSDSGYRVAASPVIERDDRTISLDVRAERWTGGSTQAIVPFEKNYSLGALEPGDYTLHVKSWGALLKTRQFAVYAGVQASEKIDEPCFFVRMHYADFLNREPDGGGLAHWTNELYACGTDEACAEVKRINVSAAFFLSIEFQQTGYYVHRIYRAAYGRRPRLAEFQEGARIVGRGVVVGSNDPWSMRLNDNKTAFADNIVRSTPFSEIYGALSNAQYVDKLIETAGITLAQGERDALVASIHPCSFTSCITRGAALRKIVEHPALERKEFNEAFVLMQYFGYLRRDPDAAPDYNFNGFDFWLAKLNESGGDFQKAEMVKAFLRSGEYRSRFAQP